MNISDSELREKASNALISEVADEYGVSKITMERELRRRGIRKSGPSRSKSFKTELEYFAQVHNKHSDKQLAEMFGLQVRGIEKRRALLGLKKQTNKWAFTQHPRGALGLRHSQEMKARMSQIHRARWARMSAAEIQTWKLKVQRTKVEKGTDIPKYPHGSWKSGWREIGLKRNFYRSRWEANYARYLEWLKNNRQIKSWEHEPRTFWFENVKRGTVSYKPDFSVRVNLNQPIEYHEVKGWMDTRSATKIKRMRKYYPDIPLIVIRQRQYQEIEKKLGGLIDGWEWSGPKRAAA